MSAFGGLEPNLAKLSWLLLLLVAVLTPTTFGLHCYKDTNGIKMRNNGEPVDVTHFEKLNCRNMSSGEVEKVTVKLISSCVILMTIDSFFSSPACPSWRRTASSHATAPPS